MKLYISADEQNRNAFALAKAIWDSGYRPDLLIGLWRGGTPVAIAIHEFFVFKGHKCANLPVKCASYDGMTQTDCFSVDMPPSIGKYLGPYNKILIVDDVFDTGNTAANLKEIFENTDATVKVATLYYKPKNNKTDIVPDYYHSATDEWIVFPHEIEGLTAEELREKDPVIAELLFDAAEPH